MSYVTEIALKNWGPYEDSNTVVLGAGAWAVVAHYDDDAQKSNWAGKSWFLGSIRFALFGERPSDARYEDDWITRGQDEGSVSLRLSCGLEVTRARKRGGSTTLRARIPGSDGEATGKHAEKALADYLAMSADDHAAGPWLGQRDIARMVLARPAERSELVEGWLGIAALKVAEAAAAQRAKARESERAARVAEHERLRAECDALSAEGGVVAELEASEASAAAELEAAEAEVRAAAKAEAVERADADRSARRARVEARLKLVAEQIAGAEVPEGADDSRVGELATAAAKAYAEKTAAVAEVERVRGLVRGDGFGGTCPVTCEECPVADDVRAVGRKMASELKAAALLARSASDAHEEATRAAEGARRAQASAEGARARLEALEGEARRLRADLAAEAPRACMAAQGAADALARAIARKDELRAEAASARDALSRARYAADRADKLRAEAGRAEAHADDLADRARTWAEAAAIVRGTRREVAEAAVREIEAGANALLSEAGIDLQVAFRWEREGKGLAGNCARCGAAFPAKASVRRCERCGADRGAKVVEGIELVPSNRSGGADDLAGLAVQLSAAAWLRDRRGTPLGVVVVDEPFARLDPARASSLGAHLFRALSSGGGLAFEQSFVVAHDAALTDAVPNRVVVRTDGRKARLEVA